MHRSRVYGIFLLAALLTVIYTLSSSGKFHIVDEVSMYAVTESLALHLDVDTNVIAWTQWVNSPGEVLGAFGPDGEVFSKKGPALSFLAAPWYLLWHSIAGLDVLIGQLQATLLFNAIVTAWTAGLLWLTAVRVGYRDSTAMVLGLFFGLATIAWPYAKQFFGEPLSALSLLGCFYGLLAWRQTRAWWWMAVAGASAAVVVATVMAHTVLIALLAAWAVVDWVMTRRQLGWGALLKGLAAFAAPLIVAGLLLMAYNYVRFASPFDTGYHFDSGEGFTNPFLQGFWGLIFSPYRSVFLHTPLFLASMIGFVPFLRGHRSPAIAIGLLSVVLIVMYSLWWMWWGGFAWGPRFLVPMTPFWILLIAPLLEAAPRRSQRLWSALRWAVYGLAAISFVVQVAAVSVNFVNYEIFLRSVYPTDWSDPLAYGPPAQGIGDLLDSPVLGQFKLMRQNLVANTDVAWLWADGTVLWLALVIGIAAAATLAGLLLLWWLGQDGQTGYTLSLPTIILAVVLPVFVIAAWVGEVVRDPHYGPEGRGYRQIIDDMCAVATGSGAFINVAPTAYQIPMNWLPGACRKSLPTFGYASDSLEHAEAVQVMEQLQDKHDRYFFVTSGLQPNDPDNTLERWLSEHAFKATDIWYDDYRQLQYATPLRLDGIEPRPIRQALLGKRAEQVTIESVRAPSVAPSGKPIPIELVYRLEAPTDQNLRWFVQLLSGQNIALAQLDTGPDDNYTLFSSLPVRETLIERAGLLVPPNTPEGEYLLIAGLYNPDAEGARLVTVDGSDFVRLGAVRVVSGG